MMPNKLTKPRDRGRQIQRYKEIIRTIDPVPCNFEAQQAEISVDQCTGARPPSLEMRPSQGRPHGRPQRPQDGLNHVDTVAAPANNAKYHSFGAAAYHSFLSLKVKSFHARFGLA